LKRYSLIQARGGEFTFGTEGIAMEGEGSDVVDMSIRKGKVSIIVPADLPDSQVFNDRWISQHTCLEIELEDGTRLYGWMRSGEAHLETD
jgi:hypothetical protein